MKPHKTIAVILLTSFVGSVNGALAEVIKTPVGALEFKQGYPTKDTIRKVYDLRDRQRATQAYLDFMSAMSMWSVFENMIRDYKQTKPGDVGVFVYQGKGKAAAIGLTYNTESIYATAWIDTKLDGPTVIEVPPNVLGIVDDGFMRYVTDLGNAGPDRGKGGKYLILPPGYKGPVPKGYFVFRSKTYRNWVMARGFVSNTGEGKKALDYYSTRFRIYPLKSGPRKNAKYVSISGIDARSIHPQDGRYFELLNKMVQHEPSSAFSAYELGLLHALGIVKGKPFKSDARMRRLLDEGARIGDAIAKVNGFASRLPKVRPYKDRSWEIIFYGGNHEFKEGAALILDARTLFHY